MGPTFRGGDDGGGAQILIQVVQQVLRRSSWYTHVLEPLITAAAAARSEV